MKAGSKRYIEIQCSRCFLVKQVPLSTVWESHTLCDCLNPISRKYGKDIRAQILRNRFSTSRDRCVNPENKSYKDYGGRGIQMKFKSAAHYVAYILEALPHDDYKGIEIDRIDNEGHYQPGNLKLSSKSENLSHTRKQYKQLDKG